MKIHSIVLVGSLVGLFVQACSNTPTTPITPDVEEPSTREQLIPLTTRNSWRYNLVSWADGDIIPFHPDSIESYKELSYRVPSKIENGKVIEFTDGGRRNWWVDENNHVYSLSQSPNGILVGFWYPLNDTNVYQFGFIPQFPKVGDSLIWQHYSTSVLDLGQSYYRTAYVWGAREYVSVEGNSYSDCEVARSESSYSDLYFKRNIGIVKVEHYTDTVLGLLSSQIR